MAERHNKLDTERVLSRIRISQLVRRLQNNALGQLKSPKGDPVAMTDGQIRSAMFLIERKLARAESPKKLDVSGTLTLERLIAGAVAEDEARPSVQ